MAFRELMFGTGQTFDYGACDACGTLFILEIPANLGEYYAGDKYYSFATDPQALLGRPGIRQIVRTVGRSAVLGKNLLPRVLHHVPREQAQFMLNSLASVRLAGLSRGAASRVLDVGCGTGLLVYALSIAGLQDVTGVDPFTPQDRTFDSGARVLRGDLTTPDGQFDLVMSHHAFEHVPDPLQTLREMRALLAPGGRILIRTPTVPSVAYERYGPHWAQLDPPRHLTVVSRRGMELLCERAELEIQEIRDDSSPFQFWGSAQVQAGHPLIGQRQPSTRAQRRAWARETAQANRDGRGDQAAWVLRPLAAEPPDGPAR